MRAVRATRIGFGEVSENTLKLAPARLLAFLMGAAEPDILRVLEKRAFSVARLAEGYALFDELKAAALLPSGSGDDPVAGAVAYCEEWQATHAVAMRALLRYSYPDQAKLLFGELEGGDGPAAVLSALTFLRRLRLLEGGAGRKHTRKADHEALAILEQAGGSSAARSELRRRVETVQSPPSDGEDPGDDAKRRAARMDALRKIHAWVSAWSEVARNVVKRRDMLIRLGIAKRRARRQAGALPSPLETPPATSSMSTQA